MYESSCPVCREQLSIDTSKQGLRIELDCFQCGSPLLLEKTNGSATLTAKPKYKQPIGGFGAGNFDYDTEAAHSPAFQEDLYRL